EGKGRCAPQRALVRRAFRQGIDRPLASSMPSPLRRRYRALSGKERVRPSLLADRRLRTVAGVDHRLVRKCKELLPDGPEQERVRALPQVRPPDGAREEDVAADHEPVGLVDEDDVTGRVAGRVTDGEGAA